jgi:nitrogenase molybdenum-iron protein alpha/beta subunit
MVSSARRVFDKHGTRLDHCFVPALRCSNMDERIVIFGGNESLTSLLNEVALEHPAAIFVVTTCSSGIIGDDARLSAAAIREQTGAAPVIIIQSDGDITGDYTQGIIDAMIAVAKGLIDPGISPEDNAVNIVAEKNLANNTDHNFTVMRDLLDTMDLRVNCRFIRDCTSEQLTGFMRGRLNLPAYDDSYGRMVRDFLIHTYGAPFLFSPFPVGFHATSEWLRHVAVHFGKTEAAEKTTAHNSAAYEKAISELRPALAGKRLFVSAPNYRIDWILETAMDLGMEIVKVGILESPWDDTFMSRFEGKMPIEWPYERERREEDMVALKPDLTLTGYAWRGMPDGFRFDTVPMCPDVGFYAGVEIARRWQRLMRLPAKEGWRNDL